MFGEEQMLSLSDYVQAALMLRYAMAVQLAEWPQGCGECRLCDAHGPLSDVGTNVQRAR